MTHPAHRAQALKDALSGLELRRTPTGHQIGLGRAVAEALGEPAKWEVWGKKLAGSRGITLTDYERVAELCSGKVEIMHNPHRARHLAIERRYGLSSDPTEEDQIERHPAIACGHSDCAQTAVWNASAGCYSCPDGHLRNRHGLWIEVSQ